MQTKIPSEEKQNALEQRLNALNVTNKDLVISYPVDKKKNNNLKILLEERKKIDLINENEVFHAASTMKTPVMIEFFKKINEGKISSDDSLLINNEFSSIVDGSKFELSSFDDSDEDIYENLGKYISTDKLVYDMITRSSNFGTNLLIDYLNAEDVNNTMKNIGAKNMKVLRGVGDLKACLLYTSPSPRDRQKSRMPSSA